MFNFILVSLVCYRLSILITQDEGPASIFRKLRAALGGYELGPNGEPITNLGRGIICPLCVGLWIALPLSFILSGLNFDFVLYWLAIAGAQTFLIRIT